MILNNIQKSCGAAFMAGLLIINEELGFDKEGKPNPMPKGAQGEKIVERLQDLSEAGQHLYS